VYGFGFAATGISTTFLETVAFLTLTTVAFSAELAFDLLEVFFTGLLFASGLALTAGLAFTAALFLGAATFVVVFFEGALATVATLLLFCTVFFFETNIFLAFNFLCINKLVLLRYIGK
jgi:hypothetical protein